MYGRRVYGSCTLCSSTFEVKQNVAWRKGVFTCSQCYHRIACIDAGARSCEACKLALPTLRAGANGSFVLERACPTCRERRVSVV